LLSGGTVTANREEDVGYNGGGTFIHTGGTNIVSSASNPFYLVLGTGSTSSGFYSLSGTGVLISNGAEYVGNAGHGTFVQAGGTNSESLTLYLGNCPGVTGAYLLSAGSLSITSASSEHVGESGIGLFQHTGGFNSVGYNLDIGAAAGGIGTYNLSGTGVASV